MSFPSANLNSGTCSKAICLVKLMKRSPQVSTKSSSVSSELQSIKTAGRAFSQEGRRATGCSSSNSKGTQTKTHSLYYYSLQKEESSGSVDKPLLSRSLNCAATDQLTILKSQLIYSTKVFVHVPLPRAGEMWPFLWLWLTFFLPPGERNPVFKRTRHSNCSSISNPVPSHHRFLPCSYSHSPNSGIPQTSVWAAVNLNFFLKDQTSNNFFRVADFLFPLFYASHSSCHLLFTGFVQSSVHNLN